MRAGELRHQVSVQIKPTGKDEHGNVRTDWTEVAKVWTKKEDLSGRELFAAQAAQSEVTTRFRLRYRKDIVPHMRLVLGSTVYKVESVLDRKGTKRELQLMCSSGLTNG